MDKEQKERDYFLAEIRNLFDLCERQNCPKFSSFLNEAQRGLAEPLVNKLGKGFSTAFFGGYPEAARVVLGVFPDYMEAEETAFPVVSYTFAYPEFKELTHRDVLGSLMGQQIKRETIGDIVVLPQRIVVFAEEKMEKVLATQIDKIGSVGVTVREGFEPFTMAQQYKEIRGTLASLRLDATVAMAVGCGREKAAKLITAGYVQLNYIEKAEGSAQLSQGDLLTVRGYGKFKLSEVGNVTRKGRLSVTILKYL